MSRPLRLEFPGALWHTTSRGVEQRPIYLDDADREHFLGVLERVIDKYRWQLHAYVLMTNHYHLLLTTPEPTLSSGMQQLCGNYAEHFNEVHAGWATSSRGVSNRISSTASGIYWKYPATLS